ncbi:hypothetical protein D3C73_611720 [compost metagenome]
MIGTKLMHLNVLKETNPELYEQYISKYKPNRLIILERLVPKLNCLWNDVIHFLPIHPNLVYRGLVESGGKPASHRFYYKIPIATVNDEATIALYRYSKENFKGIFDDVDSSEIELLDIQGYRELDRLPEDTIDYYREQIRLGNKFGVYHFVPHIFIKGEVDIEHVEIIDWSENTNIAI